MRQKRRLRDHAGLFERTPYARPKARRPKIAKRLSTAATTGDTFPTVTCGLAYGSGPTTDLTTATFTNEVTRLKSGSTTRGRSNELDAITTGTARATFLNADRNFDPNYNTNVVPLLPVRFSAVFNATTVPLFTGYVTGWPQEYNAPNYAETNVTCVDALEVIRNNKVLGDPWFTQWNITTPTHWYRFGDSDTTARDITSQGAFYTGAPTTRAGVYSGNYTQGADSCVTMSTDDKATTLAGGSIGFVGLTLAGVNVLSIWFTSSATDGLNRRVLWNFGTVSASTDYAYAYLNTTGGLSVELQGGIGSDTILSTGRVDDGNPHHAVVVVNANGNDASSEVLANTCYLWVDGVKQDTSSATFTTMDTSYLASPNVAARVGDFVTRPAGAVSMLPWAGKVDELMVWTSGTVLTNAQQADFYNAGDNGWENDTTGQRVGRYLDAAGWPAAMRDLDAGYTTMTAAGSVTDAMAGITTAVKAEAGLLFATPLGKVAFRDRYRRLIDNNSLSPIATFGDGSGSEFPYLHDGFVLQYDRDRIRTAATGNRANGPTITVIDAGNRAGLRTEAIGELAVTDDNIVRARLEYVVDKYSDPVLRVDSIAVRPRPPEATDTWAFAMLWSVLLNADLSQQIAVVRRPQGLAVGSAITLNVLVEQVTHNFAPFDWVTVVALSPADTKRKFRWNYSPWDTANPVYVDTWAF